MDVQSAGVSAWSSTPIGSLFRYVALLAATAQARGRISKVRP